MTAALFFALLSGLALFATVGEYVYSRSRKLGWHDASDTLTNVNLAAGQLVMATLTTGFVLGGYALFYSQRLVTLSDHLPRGAYLIAGFLLAELLQYWNHRLSHRYNFLVWGHATHHSSSHLNMSTGVRINWFYRAYAWVLFVPMALVGYTVAEFVLFQALMNVYNLFMHTRFNPNFGPLKYVLVTPQAHRLHHSSNAAHYGNYGASLILWDRLFGTYREIAPADEKHLRFGMEHNVDESSPLRLNFHHLQDLAATARATGVPLWRLLLSTTAPDRLVRSFTPRRTVAPGLWVACALVLAGGIGVNTMHATMGAEEYAFSVILGVGLTVMFASLLRMSAVNHRGLALRAPAVVREA